MTNKGYFIAGIDTDVGKTVVSAILVTALKADYWKPVQTGTSMGSDSQVIRDLCGSTVKIHPEAVALPEPHSPYASAVLAGKAISLRSIELPKTSNSIVVEGSGGLLVPLNEQDFMIDLLAKLGLPAILVIRNYLGSINHSLLSIEALRNRGLPIHGLVFSGPVNTDSENVIINKGEVPCLARFPEFDQIDQACISEAAQAFSGKV